MKNSNSTDISITKIRKAQDEIRKFDTVLDDIQKLFPLSTKIGDLTANARYDLFVLMQAMRGLEDIDYSRLTESAWLDLREREQEI